MKSHSLPKHISKVVYWVGTYITVGISQWHVKQHLCCCDLTCKMYVKFNFYYQYYSRPYNSGWGTNEYFQRAQNCLYSFCSEARLPWAIETREGPVIMIALTDRDHSLLLSQWIQMFILGNLFPKVWSMASLFVMWTIIDPSYGAQYNMAKNNYRQIYHIRRTKSANSTFLVSSCSSLCAIYWSHLLSGEWRSSWSRRCSNYIWVINNFIAY